MSQNIIWNSQTEQCSNPPSGLYLYLLLSFFKPSPGFLTNISFQESAGWGMKVSNYEAIFLGLIYIKVMALRGLEILPITPTSLSDKITFNNFVGLKELSEAAKKGQHLKRFKKRNVPLDPDTIERKLRMGNILLDILRKLDEEDCILEALCELQSASVRGQIRLPDEMRMTLSLFSQLGWKRIQNLYKCSEKSEILEKLWATRDIEDAVLTGWDFKAKCSEKYPICSLTQKEILDHYNIIKLINVLPIKF